MCATDITSANDGRVMVVDRGDSCVHIFSEHCAHLDKFKFQGCYYYPRIAFHMLSEHVVIAGTKKEEPVAVVEIFTKDGVFVRSTQIHKRNSIRGMTVAKDGRIALLLQDIIDDKICKVLVV